MMDTLFEVIACAKDLTLAEQRELVQLLSENIQHLEETEGTAPGVFQLGDKVKFDIFATNEVTITIESFSSDGKGIQGRDAQGTLFIVLTAKCRPM